MSKIAWVALPLVFAALVVAGLAWRRRMPSRHALNIGSSLLLLGYLLATAGLGIFWVANQQLPVFDWHYLFGYGTVLLTVLHLMFNLPVVWRFLTRPARPVAAAVASRRGLLAGLGVVLAGAAGYFVGMRHGRSDLHLSAVSADPPGGDAHALGLQLVERFHAFSSHSRASLLWRAPGAQWGDPPPPFKSQAGLLQVDLTMSATAPSAGVDRAALAALLWHTVGVTSSSGGLSLRASPSSGALFSTELYVAARRVAGLRPGLWHYDPQRQRLAQVRPDAPDDVALGLAATTPGAATPAVVIATAIFGRTGHKYRDRAYRYVLADLGHALENLRVAAHALGLPLAFASAFDEARLAAALGIDPAHEGVLAVAWLGEGRMITAPRLPAFAPGLSAAEVTGPLAVTAAVHAATSLRLSATARPVPARDPVPPLTGPAPDAVRLPRAERDAVDMLPLIAARRSVRRYADTALGLEALAGVLAATALDEPVFSAAVRLDVVVHAVHGLAPGAYRYGPREQTLEPRRVAVALRDAARAAALDQAVIGDAAVVVVLSIDRAVFAADALGPARGYRHAFLEAGLVGERLYLEAGARGLGVCAVGAFYDAEAAALVAVDPAEAWVVHFAGLGVLRA